MYSSKTPKLIKALASDLVWNRSRKKRSVFLTFDDGPTPGVTDKVLDILYQHKAKATFFCVGEMIQKSPELLERMKNEGHSIGNHTMRHENGWKTSSGSYFRSFLECQELTRSTLFRPPYGRISKSQSKAIKKRCDIIMWDVLPGDFDTSATAEICLTRIKKNTQNGSIIVLHDSQKCGEKVLKILPSILDWHTQKGFELKTL